MKTFNKKESDKNIKKFADLEKENFAKLNLQGNEQIKHCIDNQKPEYYQTGWAVTSEGRVWSLKMNRWLVPRNQNGYWRIANVYVHRLVEYYFMTEEEKNIQKVLLEHNKKQDNSDRWSGEVHHLKAGEKKDSSNMTWEERVKACMEVNNKSNLILQIEADHKDVHRIMKGEQTVGEREGTEQFDSFLSVMKNLGADRASVTYTEEGKRQINMVWHLKGTTPEEDEKLDKEIGFKFLI